MSTLTSYNGLSVVSPEPTAPGGKAINDNFKALSTPLHTTNPGASDDGAHGFSAGSRWFNSTTQTEFICTSNAVGAAVWEVVAAPSPWLAGTSSIYFDGGNVGIGTTSPAYLLDLGNAYVEADGAAQFGNFWINPTYLAGDSVAGINMTDGSAAFASGNMMIDPAGNVGIGTSSPASPLDVAGASASDSFIAKPQSSAPASPVPGQIYYNDSNHHFYGWNGSAWKQLDN